MAKKITLVNPHFQGTVATEYTLVKLLVQYEIDTAIVILKDQDNRQFSRAISPIPNTTQENAILALVNNGDLAGVIGDV